MRWVDAIDRWTDWMRAGGARPQTVELRRYQVARMGEAHLRRSPWKVTTDDLVAWLGAQDWSAETRRSYRSALRSFYGWAKIAGHVRRDPSLPLPAVRAPEVAPKPTPDDVLDQALDTVDDRARLILYLAAYAGLRRAEIAGLHWDDVGDAEVRVYGKGGRVRVVPLHPALAHELEMERKRRQAGGHGTGYRYTAWVAQGGWVFPGQSGNGPMTPNALGKAACRALGDGWTAHSLRHRFATKAYAGTRDLVAVQELLGHVRPETTRRYTQLPDGALLAAVHSIR